MTHALRVLVVSHSESVWGAEQVLLRLAPELDARGVELIVACPARSEQARAWADLGATVVGLDLPVHRGLRTEGGSRPSVPALGAEAAAVVRSARRIARAARAHDVDVVHSNSLSAHVEAALAAKLAHRGAVVHVHDLVAPGAGRRLLAATDKLGARLIAISSAVAACLPPGRATIVPNGVDEDRFRPGPADPAVREALGGVREHPLVGVVGRLDPEKRVELVIRAVGAVPPHIGLRLAVVGAPLLGSAAYVEMLHREADHLLPGRVQFVAPRTDMPEVMRAFDVVVSASRAEPFGLTLLEAQASGVPVAAVRTGGIPDFVHDGETGLLADTPEGLADAIRRLATDPALGAAVTERARAMVCAAYTLRQQSLRLVEIYGAATGALRPEPV